jgi:hypothetical protein
MGGTVITVVAKPHIDIVHQPVLEAPLGVDHFLAWVRFLLRRKRADHRTGGTLKAFFQGVATRFLELPNEAQIGLHQGRSFTLYLHCGFICHGNYLLETLIGIGTNFIQLF